MAINNPIKRVPKWAWLVAGGVGAGGLALRFFQNKRDAADAEAAGATGTDPATGNVVGTAPPGVVVPPVIMGGGGGDDGAGSAALSDLAGVLGQGFTDVLGTAAGLAWTPAEISGLVGGVGQQLTDQTIAIIGAAGGAPQPASQQPTVINVTAAAPDPQPPTVPTKGVARCVGAYPNGTPPNCYKDCQHTEKDSKGKSYCNQGHCYSDGRRVHVRNTAGAC